MDDKREKEKLLLTILALKESIEKDLEKKKGIRISKKKGIPEKAEDRFKRILKREEKVLKPVKKIEIALEDVKTFFDIPMYDFDVDVLIKEIDAAYKEETSERYNLLAIATALKGNFDEALSYIKNAYAKKADLAFLLNEIEITAMQGKLEKAVTTCLSFLKKNPDYAEGYLELAKNLFLLGMNRNTWLKLLHTYVQLEKDTFKKGFWKGIELSLDDNAYEAISTLSSTLRYGKNTALISNIIAYIRMWNNDFEEANRNLNIAKKEDFACVHCNIASLDFLSDNVSSEELKHLHSRYPYCFSISKTLIKKLILEDRCKEAIEEANQLLESDIANDPETLYVAGLAFYHSHDLNSADKIWGTLFEKYPSTSVSLLYKHEIVKKQGIFGTRYLKSTNLDHSRYKQNFASTLKKLLPLFAKKNSYNEKSVDFAFRMPNYSTFYQAFAGNMCKYKRPRF